MSKATKKSGKAVGKATVKKVVAERQVVESAPDAKVLRVKGDIKYSGARAAWYAALCQHSGKSAEDFVAACSKTPPTLPKNGKAENPRGWLQFFMRAGVASLS
jgi:hypothetical protein